MRESGGLDTGDLVLRAFGLLHERPDVRLRASERFAHVLVDDFQDVNFAEGTGPAAALPGPPPRVGRR